MLVSGVRHIPDSGLFVDRLRQFQLNLCMIRWAQTSVCLAWPWSEIKVCCVPSGDAGSSAIRCNQGQRQAAHKLNVLRGVTGQL